MIQFGKLDSVKEYFVMNTSDFIDLWRHHKKYVEQKCDFVCPKNEIYYLHKRLNELTDYVEWIRDRNLNVNTVVSKIALFLEKDSTRRGVFWWYSQDILDFQDVPENVTMKWRAQFFFFFLRNHFSNCYHVNR